MTFTEVFRSAGTVEQFAKRLKQNDLHRFANLPANVYHSRAFDEPLEFPKSVTETYAGVRKAHKLLYSTLLQVAPKMHNLNFCIDLDYQGDFNNVFVFDRLESVGRISYDDDGALEFCNARIDEALIRKRKIKTKAVSKAVATIRKYFYGMTKVETMQSMAGLMKAAVSSAHSDTIYKKRGAKQRVTEELERAVFSDSQLSQAVLQYFEATNQSHLMAKYEDAKDDFELVEEAYNAQRLGKGLYVQAVGEEYQMWRKDSTRVQTCNRNSIPIKVRGALGMLKLADDNSFVNEVGFKMEAERFWIAEELANELNS